MKYHVDYSVDGEERSIEVCADDELTGLFLAGAQAGAGVRDATVVEVTGFRSVDL